MLNQIVRQTETWSWNILINLMILEVIQFAAKTHKDEVTDEKNESDAKIGHRYVKVSNC